MKFEPLLKWKTDNLMNKTKTLFIKLGQNCLNCLTHAESELHVRLS